MLNRTFLNGLREIQQDAVLFDEPMKNHTSFQIGGPADIFIEPQSIDAFAELIRLCGETKTPFLVMGAGSNLLVGDKGIRGAVIKTGKTLDFLEADGDAITAGAGTLLAKLANFALDHNLAGLEFSSGIPGLVGGAVYMNAGAYGGEMKDVVTRTDYIDSTGKLCFVEGAAHMFGYRSSVFAEGGKYIVRTCCKCQRGSREQIAEKMRDFNGRRREKQPLEFPSAGSTFKRPEGYFAGKLIQDAGLQGCQIGGARVSDKHAGFVINAGEATADDVWNLITHIQNTVLEKFGVALQTEVKRVGEF